MKNFIEIPNIPAKKVSSVIVDYRINPVSLKTLHSLGICVYTTKRTSSLYEAVCGHPDMVMYHLGGKKFIVSPENVDYIKKIPNIEVLEGKSRLNNLYPKDIAYNAARVGNFLIHNFKYTDHCILENTQDLIKINVNQGYSKCSVCVISQNAVITSDIGIAKKCDTYGIDVLLTDDSSIVLNGVSHGFIGGSAGLIAPSLLAVNGNLVYHKNFEEIEEFCGKYNVEIVSLHDGLIQDIGTIVSVTI